MKKTDEDILDEYATEMELGEVGDACRGLLLQMIKMAREDEPQINSGVHLIDWMNMHEDDTTMEEYYGQDYFKEPPK